MPAVRKPLALLACLGLAVLLAACDTGKLLDVGAEVTAPTSYHITVYYKTPQDGEDFSITCSLPDVNGAQVSREIAISSSGLTSLTLPLQKPGAYTVSCTDGKATKEAGFQMTEAAANPGLEAIGAMQPPPPQEASAGQPPAQPTGSGAAQSYTHAEINFDLSKITFNETPVGGGTDIWFSGYCWPPQDYQKNGKSYFTIGVDGKLSGECSVDTSSDHILGKITGAYSKQDGSVNFELESSHKYVDTSDESNYSVATVYFTGSGKLVDGTVSDTAQFTIRCSAHGSLNCREKFQDLKYTGSVPFTLTFLP